MTIKDIAKEIKSNLKYKSIKSAEIETLITDIFNSIKTNVLEKGEKVSIFKFGSFLTRSRKPRTGVGFGKDGSKKPWKSPKYDTLTFKINEALKNELKNK